VNSPQATPAVTLRSRLKLVLTWVVGFGLLGWLLQHVPLAQAKDALMRPSAPIWALTLGGLLLSYGLRSARLQVVLDLDNHQAPPRRWLGLRTDALRVILMHNAAINLLPMRAGELSFPWLASRELGYPVARAVACLLWMRLQDITVLVGLGIVLWPGLASAWRVAGLATIVLGWVLLLAGLRSWDRQHPSDASAPNGLLGRWLNKLRHALLESAHHRTAAWLLTLSNWVVKLAAGAVLLSAIADVRVPVAWAGALGGELAAIVPLQGPAGFGTYEAGVWAGMATNLGAASPALTQAIPAAIALHLCFLACAVVAGVVALLLTRLKPAPATR
jgi:Lysylphosphatidylglycerol synthase TM region